MPIEQGNNLRAAPLSPRWRASPSVAAVVIGLAAVVFAGCEQPPSTPRIPSQQARLRQASRSDALLEAALNHLRDLPASISTKLQLPEVVLDSTKSSDGQDVLAMCLANPAVPDGPINFFVVPNRNAWFRRIGVKPGDIVKYHAGLNKESLEAGFEERIVLELTVAQVPDEQVLIVEGGLNQPVTEPIKLEVWRYVGDRMVEISRQLRRYDVRRLPPVGWQPSPDAAALDQIVVQLNEWLRQSEPEVEWQVDPLLETLDADLKAEEGLKDFISPAALAATMFAPYDGRLLAEAVWMRDISGWAHGSSFESLSRAEALFDWTVRNIQLTDASNAAPERPWQTLLYGRGTAEQRAWVFALLCRQQGLDVVMLGFSGATKEGAASDSSNEKPKFWLPALVLDGKLYLFDTRLGLPIPGPGKKGIATLAEVRQDDSLLRQLDLDGSPYPVTSGQLEKVVAYVVADPFDLTRRARQLESKLAGDDRLALSVRASELTERVKSLEGVADVQIWAFPFSTLNEQLTLGRSARHAAAMTFEPFAWRPVLWKARTRHFQGRKELADENKRKDAEELIDDHRDASRLYMDKSIRPPDRSIAKLAEEEQRIGNTAKLDATYWQGLLLFDDGKYDVAAQWLERDELVADGSPWASGARYNLARTLEAQGKLDEAVKLLEEGPSPQQQGNRLRAKWLRERGEGTK